MPKEKTLNKSKKVKRSLEIVAEEAISAAWCAPGRHDYSDGKVTRTRSNVYNEKYHPELLLTTCSVMLPPPKSLKNVLFRDLV